MGLFFLLGAKLRIEDWQRWALGGLAVLYNPLLPIRLGEKGIWEVLNVATVVLFWVKSARLLRTLPERRPARESVHTINVTLIYDDWRRATAKDLSTLDLGRNLQDGCRQKPFPS